MVALKDSSVRRGTATITSPTGDVTIRIRTRPLPVAIKEFLLKHTESMKQFLLDRRAQVEEDAEVATEIVAIGKKLSFTDFRKQLEDLLSAEGGEWRGIIDRFYRFAGLANDRICAFGPRRIGPNILIDSTDLDFRKMYLALLIKLIVAFLLMRLAHPMAFPHLQQEAELPPPYIRHHPLLSQLDSSKTIFLRASRFPPNKAHYVLNLSKA